MTLQQLAVAMQVDSLQLEPVLETLCLLDWVGQLDEAQPDTVPRFVLLANPDATPLAPLMELLLMDRTDSTLNLWENGRWPLLNVRDAL